MTIRQFEVHAQVMLYGDEIALWMFRNYGSAAEGLAFRRHVVEPINPLVKTTEVPVGGVEEIRQPSLTLDRNQAERIMTALWGAGIRPHGISGDDTERVKLLKEHISDLKERFIHDDNMTATLLELFKGAQEIILDVAPTVRTPR